MCKLHQIMARSDILDKSKRILVASTKLNKLFILNCDCVVKRFYANKTDRFARFSPIIRAFYLVFEHTLL